MSKRPADPCSTIDTPSAKKRTLPSYTLGASASESDNSAFSQWAPSDIVILQPVGRFHAQDPSKSPVSFEASRCLLSRESQVFSDMFHFPQPDASESTEERPTIELYDDVDELEKFLEVIHDYRVYFASESWKEFGSIAAILRLSTKYQVNHLRQRMVEHLESTYYPTNFEAYKSLATIDTPPAQHLCAIRLLMEVDVKRLLPMAFFSCLAATQGQYEKLYNLTVTGCYEPLAEAEAWFGRHRIKERLFKGGFLFDEHLQTILHWFTRVPGRVHGVQARSTCRSSAVADRAPVPVDRDATNVERGLICEVNSYRWLTDSMSIRRRRQLRVCIDYLPQAVERLRSHTEKLCPACDQEAEKVLRDNDTRAWTKLPLIFELPSWEELLQEPKY